MTCADTVAPGLTWLDHRDAGPAGSWCRNRMMALACARLMRVSV